MTSPSGSSPCSLLQIDALRVELPAVDRYVPVVRDLSLSLQPGQTLGIVGESGSGKTMTALALMGLLPPLARVGGQAWFRSPVAGSSGSERSATSSAGSATPAPVDLLQLSSVQMQAYRGDQLAMIFQEPSAALNPVFSCGYQLRETIRASRSVSPAEAQARARALLQEVQLPETVVDRYPHQLSGGQQQRVAIAIAIACDPQLLIADEPTTALDVTVQAEILKLMRRLQQQRDMALIFITHDLGVIAEVADQVLVMFRGEVVEQGPVEQIFTQARHPYTQGLLACRPRLEQQLKRLPTTEDFLTSSAGSGSESGPDLGADPNAIDPEASHRPPQVEQILRLEEISAAEIEQRLQQLQGRPPLLQVNQLKTYFPVKQGVFRRQIGQIRAVDGVSFSLYPGETLGLVGESGCGKSTLGRTILRLERATGGEVVFDGDDLLTLGRRRLRGLRRHLQLIFQDPFASLDPRMSVGAAVMEPMGLHQVGGSRQAQRQRAEDLFAKVGLDPQSLDRMPHEFSGGQRQRICIARALASEPRLVICDEAVSSLDVSVQAQVLNLLKDLQQEFELTYIFISHDLSVVKFMSDRIMVMNQGRIEEIAPASQIYTSPQSSYTRQLIAAVPQGDPVVARSDQR